MTHGPLNFCWKFGPCFFFEVDPSKIKVIGVPSMYGFTSKLGPSMAGQPDKPPEIAGLITGLLKGNQLVNKPLIRPAISGGGGGSH